MPDAILIVVIINLIGWAFSFGVLHQKVCGITSSLGTFKENYRDDMGKLVKKVDAHLTGENGKHS